MNPVVALIVGLAALGGIYWALEASAELGVRILDTIAHRLRWRRYQKRREARGLPRL